MFGRKRKREDAVETAPDPAELAAPDGAPIPSIFDRKPTRKPDLIVPDDLVPPLWSLSDEAGRVLADRMRFLKDGRIDGAPHPGLAAWTLDDGMLRLLSPSGEPECDFVARDTRGGLPVLSTRFDPATEARVAAEAAEAAVERNRDAVFRGIDLEPETAPPPPALWRLAPNQSDLSMRAEIDGGAVSLLVTFEGATAAPTDWLDAAGLHASRVRFEERLEPRAFYLNKTRRITAAIDGLARPGTRRIVLAGSGDAGFVCMLFAELMAGIRPDLEIVSLAIDAPVRFGDEQFDAYGRDAAHGTASAGAISGSHMLVGRPTAQTVEQRDTWFADVVRTRETMRRKQGRLCHVYLYDAADASLAEAARSLGELPNAELHPIEGAPGAILSTGRPRQALERLLDPAKSPLPDPVRRETD